MKSFDFFSTLMPTSQQNILNNCEFKIIPQGMQLYAQGDICNGILFLTKGRVRVVRQNENGQSVLLYYFSQGEQCNVNFTSSYNSAPAVGTAIAETQLEGYDIPVELVAKLFIEDKEFQRYVFDQYVKRLESMATVIEEVRFLSLDTRLLHWLQSQEQKEINISHEQLGEIVGTSREVVSRILKSFEKNNILKLSRKRIELL
ncbi:Crp/Fnr family transcriptional regulator [Poseidonibacter ostreae]|jgi:CRP/FNR family transcriptional regulator, anaerobic regulatory protein|uniref:Helix-turn-helix domain-containing protein n=1 Tax=Poseidonibacter ostreae TaxID=2654171 RepID=A0A6L4WYJ2_9BACT|nr:Crp/Fnr family transcriptional regulator [Poseidonibacter ostreae]KAB7887349.1 helix-turn-helix domain-containing protein [Poseidonibacter ostreae]KAB7890075.1 helix-turn-helix domain-containing protein [Poseidonibacter ostreae]KAB7890806.1 helix-turn-helix domain-containing protein [Poseidonibacter ostreae]MAC83931.1 Crp/Fnr family transcriptional regulator [Arcobacter sp.]|tara:strand:+ start:2631 stop:3236 length:606 start_codon:yes stop_codon:yes gene_type:complete